jgi:hypothetical protein
MTNFLLATDKSIQVGVFLACNFFDQKRAFVQAAAVTIGIVVAGRTINRPRQLLPEIRAEIPVIPSVVGQALPIIPEVQGKSSLYLVLCLTEC